MQYYNHRQRLDWLNIEEKAAGLSPSLKVAPSVFQRIRHASSKNLVIIDLRLEIPEMLSRTSVYSKDFSAAGNNTWYLVLKPSKCNHMYLNLCNDYTHQYNVIFLRFTSTVFNLEEKVLYSCDSGSYVIFPTDIPFDLLQWSMKSFQVVNCPVRITCWLEISNVQKSFIPSVLKYDINTFQSLRSVVDDLKVGLCNPIGADVLLRIKGVSIIKVHKYILCMRSPIFKNMLAQGGGGKEVLIDIQDVSAPAMTELVSYLYTGSKNVLGFRDTLDLYFASGKYEIKCLKDDCRNDLLCHLQIDNACDLFVFAYQHSDKFLEDEIVSFLNDNFEDVVNTKSFAQLYKNDNILQTLLHKHFQKCPEC